MLKKEDLDHMVAYGCESPGCDHTGHEGPLFLHSRCHIEAPVWPSYEFGTGKLILSCSKCRAIVAEVAVEE